MEAKMEFSQYLNLIENKLQSNFDKNDDFYIDGYTYDLFAEYHQRSERFFLTKKATIFGIENNEYILIKHKKFEMKNINIILKKIFKIMKKNILDNYIYNLIKSVDCVVKPHDDHMSSIITGIIVLDNNITSKNNCLLYTSDAA